MADKIITLDELVQDAEEKVNTELSIMKDIKKHFPGLMTNAELSKNKDLKLEWLIDGLLLKGGSSLLVAEPKVGKSFFARQLGVAIAKGEKVLTRSTTKGLVFYISVEDHPAWVKKHMNNMGADKCENIMWSMGRIKDMSFVEGIEFLCQKLNPAFIVVDTMMKVFKVNDINNYSEIVDALQRVTEVARKYGTHIMYIHHVNKSSNKNGFNSMIGGSKNNAALTKIMGSMGIAGEVDNILFLTREGDTRFLQTIPRCGDVIDEVMCWDEKKQMYLINEVL